MPSPIGTTYWLDRWVWDQALDGDNGGWRRPDGAFAGIDARGAQQAVAGGDPDGWCLCACEPGYVGTGDGVKIADSLDGPANVALIRDTLGLAETPQGLSLLEVMALELFGALADPDGLDHARPMTPTHKGLIEFHLKGHSRVFSRRYRQMPTPFRERVELQTQRVFERIRAESHALHRGGGEPVLHRKWLHCTAAKMGLLSGNDYERLMPEKYRGKQTDRPVKPTTTLNESWPTNGTTISTGQDLTWTEVSGDGEVASGAFRDIGENATVIARAEHDLSSDDQLVSAVIAGGHSAAIAITGAQARFSASAITCYDALAKIETGPVDQVELAKRVGGVFSLLAETSTAHAPGGTVAVEADGGAQRSLLNAAQIDTASDTEITGNLRSGCVARQTGWVGAWEAADLVAGGLSIPIAMYHYMHRVRRSA